MFDKVACQLGRRELNKLGRTRIVRFGLVGTAVAALYVGLFTVLVALEVQEFLANVLAVVVAVMFQYVMQTAYTFRNRILIRGQAMRFIFTIGIGLAISTPITTIIGPAFGWKEYFSASIVVVLSSLTNYVLFTFWVYRKKDSVD